MIAEVKHEKRIRVKREYHRDRKMRDCKRYTNKLLWGAIRSTIE